MIGELDKLDAQFLADFRQLGTFGQTARGGVDRQAGTAADGQQRAWFADWLTGHRFRVELDQVGNLFGFLDWIPDAPYVLAGSHLDSQPLGGKYDGAYGVIAAAHAAHRLDRAVREGTAKPLFNLAVVDWFNEEGSRFEPSMMGSAVFTGKMPAGTALATRDRSGVSVAEALTALGSAGWGTLSRPPVHAYAEIHVEQGRVLEDEGTTIGLVTSTWAARKFDVTVNGEQSHTGSTIMSDRRDALLGAAHLVVAVRALAETYADAQLHTSVARFDVAPNSPVVVARQVRMNIDLRCEQQAVLDAAEVELRADIDRIAALANVDIDIRVTHAWDQQAYSHGGVRLARAAATDLQLSHREIMTIAGHDSTNMKDVVPTVMLFVPSVAGIAHNEGEFTRDDDCLDGVRLMTDVLSRLCSGDFDGPGGTYDSNGSSGVDNSGSSGSSGDSNNSGESAAS